MAFFRVRHLELKEPGWHRGLRRLRQRARPLSPAAWRQSCGQAHKASCAESGGAADRPSRLSLPGRNEFAEPEVGMQTLQCRHDIHAGALHQVPWLVGTMQPCQVAFSVAEKKEGQQRPEQCQKGRCQAIRIPRIYVAFFYEVGWTGTTMAEVNARRKAGKDPGGGESRTPPAGAIAAASQAGRRAAGGGAGGQSSHRKLAEEHGISIRAEIGAGYCGRHEHFHGTPNPQP